jgi:hypothetical protein
MTRHALYRDSWLRRGIASASLVYVLAFVFLPAHAHEAGLESAPEHHGEIPHHSQPDHDADCFLCQVLGTAALPPFVAELAERPPVTEAEEFSVRVSAQAPVSSPSNARAPPTHS